MESPDLTRMPFPIAGPVAEISSHTDPNRRFRAVIRAFASTIKYNALLLLSDYVNRGMPSRNANAELSRWLARPSLGHWNATIRLLLTDETSGTSAPYFSAFRDFYFEVGSRKPTAAARAIDELINLRNEFIHPDVWPSSEVAASLSERSSDLLDRLVRNLDFLSEYRLVAWYPDSDRACLCHGPSPDRFLAMPSADRLGEQEGPYVFDPHGSTAVLLHPFLILAHAESDDLLQVLLYETMRGRTAKFLLSNRYYFDSDRSANRLAELLEELRKRGTAAAEETGPATPTDTGVARWDAVRKLARADASRRVAILREQVAQKPLYVRRSGIMREFHEFLDSGFRGMVLVGDSGTGKSNICVGVHDESTRTQDVLAFLRGSEHRGGRVDEWLVRDVLAQQGGLGELLQGLEALAKERSGRFILLVDAVNEAPDPGDLCEQLVALVEALPVDWFKVAFTCRSVVWRTLEPRLHLSPSVFWTQQRRDGTRRCHVTLGPFTSDELEQAFGKYQKRFGFRGDLPSLSVEARMLIRDPLMLRAASTVYRDAELPTTAVTSRVIDEYLRAKTRDRDRPFLLRLASVMRRLGSSMLREPDLEHDEKLQEYVFEDPVDAIEEAFECQDASCPATTLSAQDLHDGRCPMCGGEPRLQSVRDLRSTYLRLLDEGVIQETQIDGGLTIRFTYDRICEHVLSLHLAACSLTRGDVKELLDSARSFPELWGALRTLLAEEPGSLARSLCGDYDHRLNELAIEAFKAAAAEGCEVGAVLMEIVRDDAPRARGTAAKAAAAVGDIEVLREACRDESVEVRADAALSAYELWQRDEEKCIVLLRQLVSGMRLRNAPLRQRDLESLIRVSFLIASVHHGDPESVRPVAEIWRDLLRGIGLARGSLLGRALWPLAEWLLVNAGVRVGEGIIKGFAVSGLHERCTAFFRQKRQERELVSRYAYLLDPDARVSEAMGGLLQLARNGEELQGQLLAGIVALHTHQHREAGAAMVAELLRDLEDECIAYVHLGFGSQLLLHQADDPVPDETYRLLAGMARRMGASRRDRMGWYRIPAHVEFARGEPASSTIRSLIAEGMERNDRALLGHCIDDAVAVGFYWNDPSFTMRTIGPLVERGDETLESQLVRAVSKLRARSPMATEESFLGLRNGRQLLAAASRIPMAVALGEYYAAGTNALATAIVCHYPEARSRLRKVFEGLPHARSLRQGLRMVAREALDLVREAAR